MSGPYHFPSLPSTDPAIDRMAAFETLSDEEFIRKFLEPAMWRVSDFPKTAWWGHLQFMFSVVDLIRPRRFVELGSHHGTSFFAANQAAVRVGHDMQALAVDSWEGEEHTGVYDQSVYDGFMEVLERQRYTNAKPLKMYFDEAAELFEPNSIDLLHIDGLHTFEAVSHDYETWIDKVVPGGLVLFHDINVHHKDFGVWRLWETLQKQTPTNRIFGFKHSHGLGVLQTEGDGFPHLSRLLQLLSDDEGLASFTQLIYGSVSELAHLASQLEPTQKAATVHREKRKELQAMLDQVGHDKKRLDGERSRLQSELKSAERGALLIESDLRAARDEAAALKKQHDAAARRSRELSETAAQLNLRAKLARAKAIAQRKRLEAERDRTVAMMDAEIVRLSSPTSLPRNVARKAKGGTFHRVDHSAVTKLVREKLLADALKESGLFDEAFYVSTYPDAANYRDEPVLHFVRHGRFEGRQPNELFVPASYANRNPDVAAQGVEPTEHYLYHGSYELRETGDGFDSPGYLAAHPEVVERGENALGSYLREGRAAGHSPFPRDGEATAGVGTRPVAMDHAKDRKTTEALLASYRSQAEVVDEILVSIVMPSFNRADVLPRALATVQAQTHQRWELFIVDDGSTDDTREVVAPFAEDPRITVIWNDHVGVSGARNAGLEAANGDFVAFLDTDNEWTPDYLQLMLTHMVDTGAESAYSAMAAIDSQGQVTRYLSRDFDWDACYNGNFVDMNVFMHRRDATDHAGQPVRFETRLKRMVDWDYILRMTRNTPAVHTPFLGCRYHDYSTDDRISMSEPMAYRELVRKRNDPALDVPPSFAELSQDTVLEFAIRISAPWANRHVWGDTHYAQALQAQIEKLGHKARLVFQDEDERLDQASNTEVNLVLRGLTPHGPVRHGFNILWVISHPEKVGPVEMAGYNMVYLASEAHAALMQHDPKVSPRVLLQATEFEPSADSGDGGVVFVGNSRKVDRPIVRWAAEENLDLRLYGGDWDGTAAAEYCLGTSFANDQLPGLYGSADFVLNDHWQSMRDFGYLSNRLFDVVAAGGVAISDAMPAIDRFFGPAVNQVTDQGELAAVVGSGSSFTERALVEAAVREDHSFEARARQIINDIFGYLNLDKPFGADIGSTLPWRPNQDGPQLRRPIDATDAGPSRAGDSLAIGALFMGNRVGYQSSAYIRVLAPLTTEQNFSRAHVVAANHPSRLDVEQLDAVIVGRTAFTDLAAAEEFVAKAKIAGTSLLVDVDDSFGSLKEGTSEYELYQPRLEALRYMIEHGDAVTVSTPGIAKAFGVDQERAHVVANTLDPRLWRRYPRPDHIKARDPEAPLRVLYMGTATHDEDFEVVLDALDTWSESEEFELTIIGAVRNPPKRSWIRSLAVPAGNGVYPRFTHWLMDRPQFDIGLAPLRDTEFNAGKSDIKFLDYCAIGAIPVLSDSEAYSGDSHKDGLSYHASNDSASWIEALSKAGAEVHQGARIDERRDWLWANRNADLAGNHLIEIIEKLRS